MATLSSKKSLPDLVGVMLIVALLAMFVGFAEVRAQGQDEILATVNGKRITQKEVDEQVASQLLPLEQQIYALRKVALENLITRAILEFTAKKKGISVDQLKRELTAGKVDIPSAQVDALYAENASVFAAMSPDEAKERLRLDLESQARMKFYRDAVAELRKNSNIESHLEEPKLPQVVTDIATSPTTGSKDAAVTIVEFSDFQCPFCKGAQDTLNQVLKSYANDVRLVFKHLPLDMHPDAFASAQAAFCAGEQGAFWKYHDVLFGSGVLSPEVFQKTAANLGLDVAKFGACVKSEAARMAILKDLDEARRLGINSTPTFIINGRVYRGAPSLAEFQAVIKHELQVRSTSSSGQR